MQSKPFNIDELTLEEIEPKQAAEKDVSNIGRKCLKCSHVRSASEAGTPAYACPQCGAVYEKVEQLLHGAGQKGI